MRTFAQKTMVATVGVLLVAGVTAKADLVYDNSSHDSGYSLNFVNGVILGNEIVLGGGLTSAVITNFSFEIYSTMAAFTVPANVKMSIYLYQNDGTPPFNGYNTPGTILFSDLNFTLQTPLQYTSGAYNVATLNEDLTGSPVTVTSSNFTFAAVVTGLDPADSVGFELFTNATVGLNYADYWANNNGGGWQLLTNAAPTSIGARFEATPEPSTLCLGAVGGALLLGSAWSRRRKQPSRQG